MGRGGSWGLPPPRGRLCVNHNINESTGRRHLELAVRVTSMCHNQLVLKERDMDDHRYVRSPIRASDSAPGAGATFGEWILTAAQIGLCPPCAPRDPFAGTRLDSRRSPSSRPLRHRFLRSRDRPPSGHLGSFLLFGRG